MRKKERGGRGKRKGGEGKGLKPPQSKFSGYVAAGANGREAATSGRRPRDRNCATAVGHRPTNDLTDLITSALAEVVTRT